MTSTSSMFSWCQAKDPVQRPEYLWSMLAAARTARNLGIDRISSIECGVAGGNGLIAMERAAERAESLLDVRIEVFGFDSGSGMPAPADRRDAPFAIRAGFFDMDVAALESRLRRAQLVLGDVGTTVRQWLREDHPPIGFVAIDLDYYSSTVQALDLLRGQTERLLPRVVCYFDDIFGVGWSEFNGERAAIAEFNQARDDRKIGLVHGLKYELPPTEFTLPWPEKIFLAHLFDHERYSTFEGLLSPSWYDELRLSPEVPQPPG